MKFRLVLHIIPSNIQNIAGRNSNTAHMLISAPLAINRHRELIISIFEYIPTPKVAAKKLKADTMMERMLELWAIWMDSFLFFPEPRSFS